MARQPFEVIISRFYHDEQTDAAWESKTNGYGKVRFCAPDAEFARAVEYALDLAVSDAAKRASIPPAHGPGAFSLPAGGLVAVMQVPRGSTIYSDLGSVNGAALTVLPSSPYGPVDDFADFDLDKAIEIAREQCRGAAAGARGAVLCAKVPIGLQLRVEAMV